MDSLKKELLVLVEKREEMTEIEETLPNKETLKTDMEAKREITLKVSPLSSPLQNK